MSYVSLEEFKTYIRNEMPSADDTDLQQSLDVADRLIDTMCERTFTVADEASERTYAPERWSSVLEIHDTGSVTSVVENGTTLVAGTDYLVEPLQTATWSGETWPYQQLRRLNTGAWYRSNGTGTVVVTGTWGWSGVPPSVKMAEKILAKDIIGHRDVKFGLVGVSDFGGIRARQASLVGEMLAPYIRSWSGSSSWSGPDIGGAGGPYSWPVGSTWR